MEKRCGVYEIVNTVNRKRYIGSSANLRKRWNEHVRDLNRCTHHCIALLRAWQKYGQPVFTFSVLEYCEKSALIEREQFYFDTLHPEYNISPTARSPLGVKHTAETRRKVSEAGKGRKFSDEHKRKIGDAHRGKVVSIETRERIGSKSKGRQFSEASRQKMSASHMGHRTTSGRPLSVEHRRKISESLIGNTNCIGREPWNKGRVGLQRLPEEARLKMSESRLGKIPSDETRRKMSEARKRYWAEKRANG